MPFARISVGPHRSAAAIKAISDGVYEALVEAVHAPEDDKFQVITRHATNELIFSRTYLGISRSDDLTFIQIFFYPGRTVAQKKLLHKTIATKLAANPGMRPEDVFIILVEVPRENWSYGNGEAQFAPREEPALTLHPAPGAAWLAPVALGLSALSLLAALVLPRRR